MTDLCYRCRRPRHTAALEVTHRGRSVWICLQCLYQLAHRWLVVRDTIDAFRAGSNAEDWTTMPEESGGGGAGDE